MKESIYNKPILQGRIFNLGLSMNDSSVGSEGIAPSKDFINLFAKLEQVEQTRSRKKKAQILESIRGQPEEHIFLDYVNWVFNPFLNFYVTAPKLSDLDNEDVDYHPYLVWSELKDLLDKLNRREISGNFASSEVLDLCQRTPLFMRKWVRRIINRSFVAGVGLTTLEKIFTNLNIPSFSLQLCTEYNEQPLHRPYLIEPKMDGIRGVIGPFGPDKEYRVLSRNGKPLWNIEHHISVAQKIVDLYGSDIVFDGEFFADNWNKSMSIVKTQTDHADVDSLEFHCFDMIFFDEFVDKDSVLPLETRKSILVNLVEAVNDKRFIYVDGLYSDDPDEIKLITRSYLDQGWEGSIVKDPGSPYIFGRSDTWMKYKPIIAKGLSSDTTCEVDQAMQEGDFEIIGVELGFRDCVTLNVVPFNAVENPDEYAVLDNTKVLRWDLVARTIRVISSYDESNEPLTSAVGGGFTLEDRKEIARKFIEDPASVIGRYIQVVYQGKTKEGALRFPEFQRFREDK